MNKWIKLTRDYDGHKAGDVLSVAARDADMLVNAGAAAHQDAGPEENLARDAVAEMNRRFDEAIAGMTATMTRAATTISGINLTPTVAQEDKTRSLADFVQCVVGVQKYRDEASVKRMAEVYKSGWVPDEKDTPQPLSRRLLESNGTAGGFRVPEEFDAQVYKLEVEGNVFADGVTTTPMGAPAKSINALRQTTNPTRGMSAMLAGVQVYRKSEKAKRTGSEPAWDQIKLEATDQIAYTEFSRDLLADAPSIQADVLDLFQKAIGYKVEYEFMFGDGVGKPLGFFNAPCTIRLARNQAGKVVFEDVVGMLASLMAQFWAGAHWIANVTVLPQLMALKDTAGNAIFFSSANGGITAGPSSTLLGMPLKWSEKVPALGNPGDLSLVAPKAYVQGLRAGTEIGISEEFLFDEDAVAMRLKRRNDGQPWLKAPIKQADGSNTLVSPFVVLN